MLVNRSISSGVITGVSRVSNDAMRVVLYCVTRVWEDSVCIAVTEVVWEDNVYLVLCGVTGVWEDGMSIVQFSAAVFVSWEVHLDWYLQELLSRCEILSLL